MNTPAQGKEYIMITLGDWKATRDRYENSVRKSQIMREELVIGLVTILSVILLSHEVRKTPDSTVTAIHCILATSCVAYTVLFLISTKLRQPRSTARTARVAYIAFMLIAMPAGPLIAIPYFFWVLWRHANNPARFNLGVTEKQLRKLRNRYRRNKFPDLARQMLSLRDEVAYLKDYPDYIPFQR